MSSGSSHFVSYTFSPSYSVQTAVDTLLSDCDEVYVGCRVAALLFCLSVLTSYSYHE